MSRDIHSNIHSFYKANNNMIIIYFTESLIFSHNKLLGQSS